MRHLFWSAALLLVVVSGTFTPAMAQQQQKGNEELPVVVLAREAERCQTLLDSLRASNDRYQFKAVPVISTEALSFELPEVAKGRQAMFIFTSPRGVEYFCEKHTIPEGALLMALGTGTQRALEAEGYTCTLVSGIETTKGLAKEIDNYLARSGKPIESYHFIQPTCDIAGTFIQKNLEKKGALFSRVETYAVVGHPELGNALKQMNKAPKLVLFYSPSGVRSWVRTTKLRPSAVSIGPVTSKALLELGFENIYESVSPHEEDLLEVIQLALEEK